MNATMSEIVHAIEKLTYCLLKPAMGVLPDHLSPDRAPVGTMFKFVSIEWAAA